MNNRASISASLAVCALAGGIAVVGLARQATPASDAPTAHHEQAASAAPAEPTLAGSVTIESFTFEGATVVQAGQTLVVENLDSAPHTFTARNGAFDTGTLAGGSSGTITMPTEPGTYEVFCSIHPSMVTTITVQA